MREKVPSSNSFNFDELSVDKYKTTEVRNKKLAGSNCYLEIEPLN